MSLKPPKFPGGNVPYESRRILLPPGSVVVLTEALEGTDIRINAALLETADDAKVKRND